MNSGGSMNEGIAKYKDRDPIDTIFDIRDKLNQIGVFLIEENWFSIENNCYSVNLVDSLGNGASNGKGVTRELALASAYGEFIERLQGNCMINKRFGSKEFDDMADCFESIVCTPDEVFEAHRMLIDENSEEKIKSFVKEMGLKSKVLYRNILNGDSTYLSDELIDVLCGSNGLCAGNTPEEAMLQGLCEIAERYSMRQFYLDSTLSLSRIPESELERLPVYSLIQNIRESGYELQIKDATLGGVLPVVVLVLFNKKQSGYILNWGASPILSVAIERCITEVFQGANIVDDVFLPFNFKNYRNRFEIELDAQQKKYLEFYISCRTGRGYVPDSFFRKGMVGKYKNAFQDNYMSQYNSLNFMIEKLSIFTDKIFGKDCSLLGFPTYRIYIPGISDIFVGSQLADLINNTLKYRNWRSVITSLRQSSDDDLSKVAIELKEYLETPMGWYESCSTESNWKMHFKNIIGINGAIKYYEQFQNPYIFLSILFLRVGDYKNAYEQLATLIKKLPDNSSPYLACCALFFKLRAKETKLKDCGLILAEYFPLEIVNQVISDISDPKAAFNYLILPNCPNCMECDLQSQCNYKYWKKLKTSIREIARTIRFKNKDNFDRFIAKIKRY